MILISDNYEAFLNLPTILFSVHIHSLLLKTQLSEPSWMQHHILRLLAPVPVHWEVQWQQGKHGVDIHEQPHRSSLNWTKDRWTLIGLILNWQTEVGGAWSCGTEVQEGVRGMFRAVESFSHTLAVWTHRCHDTLIQPSVIDCSICVWPCRRSSANQMNHSCEGGANEQLQQIHTEPEQVYFSDLWSDLVPSGFKMSSDSHSVQIQLRLFACSPVHLFTCSDGIRAGRRPIITAGNNARHQ